jgi:hypothetical protein
MNPAEQLPQRPAYEVMIDEFMALDRECQELVEKFSSGKILYECMPSDGAKDVKEFMDKMVGRFNAFQEYLKAQIEKRNAKLQEASNAMRSAVMAGESFVRGVDGKSTIQKYGPFEVASKTFRSFNPGILLGMVAQLGLQGRLKDHTTIDKNTGEPVPVIQEEIKILFEPVKNWLREQNLENIIQEAYEEEEGTPAVTGPKELGWLGTTKKKGK